MSLRIYCQFCSAEVRNDSNICPTCGRALEDVAARRLEEGSGVQKKPAKTNHEFTRTITNKNKKGEP
jgi:hypothetical protein